MNHLHQVIDAAAALGVGQVNSFIGRDPALLGRGKLAAVPGNLAAADRSRRKQIVRIGIENCPMLFTQDEWPGGKNLATTPAIWRRMFHDIPSRNFGLNFDPSHLIWQQMDYLAPLADFRDRIFHVHAKDARIDQDGARSARGALLSQALAYPQDPRPGRRPLGSLLRGTQRRRLCRSCCHRSRRSGLRGLARRAARLTDHQPAVSLAVHQGLRKHTELLSSRRVV